MYIYELLVLVVTIVSSVAGGGSGDGPNVQIPRYNNFIPTSCRDVVFKEAKNPLACSWVTRKQIGQEGLLNLDPYHWAKVSQLSQDKYTGDNVYNDLLMSVVATPTEAPGTPNAGDQPAGANLNGAKQNPTLEHADKPLNPDNLPGACRWDYQRSNQGLSACLCPATKQTCSLDRKACYWYKMPEEKAHKLANQGVVYIPTHACINSAERFYFLLAGLLKKRGKKDFAIKIRYGATPARGQLPLGPYGPAIIGGGAFSSQGLATQAVAKKLMSRFSSPGWSPNYNPYASQSHYPAQSPYPSPSMY